MNSQTALSLLGLEPGASPEQIQAAHAKGRSRLEQRIAGAPTENLRNKYRLAQEKLDQAHAALSQATAPAGGLSATQMRDLPGAAPSFTQGDSAPEAPGARVGLQPGQVLAGRYEIRRRIGAGGMGAVFAVLDRNREQEIAIKVMLPGLVENEQAQQRFLTEAQISTQLSHPGIANVFDVQADGDFHFLTMELLEGRSLREEINARQSSGRPFEIDEVRRIGQALCEALQYAHRFTVHRDVKPENVWLCTDGTVKLMDFGIARVLRTSQLTMTGMALGTAYYMAPEQLQGAGTVDHRADQYSVGVVLYELLTGRLPTGRFKPAKALRKEVGARFSAALDRALGGLPEDRFEDMDQLATALAGRRRGGFNLRIAAGVMGALLLVASVFAVSKWTGPFDGSSGTSGRKSDQTPPIEDDPKVAALETRGVAQALAAQLIERRKSLERTLREARRQVERLESARRSAKGNDREEIEAQLAGARSALALTERIRERCETRIFQSQALIAARGKLALGESILREKEYSKAYEAFHAAKTSLETLLQQVKVIEVCEKPRGAAEAAQLAWKKLARIIH